MSALLAVDGVTVTFPSPSGARAPAAEAVKFEIGAGETVGLVGESGSGKSVTALSILRLLEPPAEVTGSVWFRGTDMLRESDAALRAIRGNRIAMVFQDPLTSLNPVMTIGEQIAEVARLHEKKTRKQAWARAVEMLELVGIPSPAERARAYPHELSGGMRQRVMIAMALTCRPDLLIADEPTTALDVTIQAQILDLLKKLQRELGMSVLLITHDLGVVAETCDVVNVMYAGRIVERAPVDLIFSRPRHPYTLGLLASIPGVNDVVDASGRRRLRAIPGAAAGASTSPRTGCRFRDRCDRVIDACASIEPELVAAIDAPDGKSTARCHNLVPLDALSRPAARP